jgi:Tfp pilus assembly protein PilF
MNLKILLFICLIIGLLVASCDSSSDPCSNIKDGLSYYEYLNEAQQYVSKGDKEKAICALKKALKIKPTDAETHFILGRLYDAEGQRSYSDAFTKYLSEILTKSNKRGIEDQTKELEKLGFKSQYHQLALQEYIQTIKYFPEHWAARYSIATDYLSKKKYKEAIDEYKQVIKLNPKHSSAYGQIAEAYLEVGACNSAIDNFTKAYKLDSDADSYYCDIGKVYIKMGNAEKTTEMINKLKGKKPYYERLTDYQFEPHGKCEPEPVNIKY